MRNFLDISARLKTRTVVSDSGENNRQPKKNAESS